jgi:hypothetical protein
MTTLAHKVSGTPLRRKKDAWVVEIQAGLKDKWRESRFGNLSYTDQQAGQWRIRFLTNVIRCEGMTSRGTWVLLRTILMDKDCVRNTIVWAEQR